MGGVICLVAERGYLQRAIVDHIGLEDVNVLQILGDSLQVSGLGGVPHDCEDNAVWPPCLYGKGSTNDESADPEEQRLTSWRTYSRPIPLDAPMTASIEFVINLTLVYYC